MHRYLIELAGRPAIWNSTRWQRRPARRPDSLAYQLRATGHVASNPTSSEPRPASLLLRLAAMVYEAVLLFGVVFVVGYALLAALRWTHPLASGQRAVLQIVLFAAIGGYFLAGPAAPDSRTEDPG
jgi:hypothetical protein